MKGFILDTDTWIEYFRRRSGVERHIAETPAEQIYASEVSIAELTDGALHSQAVEKHLKEPRESPAIRSPLSTASVVLLWPTACISMTTPSTILMHGFCFA